MFRSYLSIVQRLIRKQPGYAFINITGLAIGMAAFFVIALYISDELSFDKHHDRHERIFRIALNGKTPNGDLNTALSSPGWSTPLVAEIPEIENMVRMKPPNQMWLVSQGVTKFYEKGFVFVDSTAFDVFSFDLRVGSQTSALQAPFSLVISESMAEKYFPDQDAMGGTLRLDNAYDFTVTGIMQDQPEQSHFKADFLASMSTLQTPIYGPGFLEQTLNFSVYSYALLAPGAHPDVVKTKIDDYILRAVGVQLESVGAELKTLMQPLASIHLDSHLDSEILPNGSRNTIYSLGTIALFILLIACINYMNLATARSASRAREVGIRKVMGAERSQLIYQFMGESVALSLLAMLVAIVVVMGILPAFNTASQKSLSVFSGGLPSAAGIFIGSALFCGLVAGSYPSLFLSRFQPAVVLKGVASGMGSSGILRKSLVIFQFATSIVLLVATVVVFQQLSFTRNMDLGFDREQVLVVQLTDPGIRTEYPRFRDRIRELSSVKSVSAASGIPGYFIPTQLLSAEGAPPDEMSFVQGFQTDFEFLESLDIELIAGRTHSLDFPGDTLDAIVLNQSAVRAFGWESPDDAIGRRVTTPGNNPFIGRVIGVMADFHAESLHEPLEPASIQITNEQAYFYAVIRTHPGQTRTAIADIETIWDSLYPAYIYQYSFLDDDVDQLYASDLTLGRLFGGFSLLTVIIACLGLFGLASFTAEQRTREIGVRKVMGADAKQIILLLCMDFARFVGLAFLIASPLVWIGMNRWLETFAFRVEFGVGTLLLVGISVLVVSLLTVSWQTIRASFINPVDALKYE